MKPVLFDTTVWIDYFQGKEYPTTQLLSEYLRKDHTILLCPIILQEILQGIKNDSDYNSIKESLLAVDILEIDSKDSAIGAAELYRSLRKKGITIRKSNDCLIAYYAIYFQVSLAHRDRDFDLIATADSRLKLWK
jgi:predicted nucleic acid-binding protein